MTTVPLHSTLLGDAGNAWPVLLLHGVFGSLENLGGIARKLAQTRRVHSLDLRNHGRSPHADSMTYAEMAADVRAYMDRHDISQAAILGHSMGGKTAMRLALDAPERVARLIVADIAPVRYPSHHDAILAGLKALNPERLASRTEADKALRPYVAEAQVRQFLLKNLVKTGEGFAWRLNIAGITKNYAAILAGQEAEHPYRGPTLFLKGGQSDYIQEQHREKVARLFPSAVLRVIPGTGHWLQAEKPDLFTTLCQRFLDGEMD